MSKSSRKSDPARRSSKPGQGRANAYRNDGRAHGSVVRRGKTGGTRVTGRGQRGAHSAGLSVRAVRIAAEVVAGASLFGGIAWAVSAQGSYSAGVIVGLVVLGLLAGLGLVTALRPAEVIRRVNRLARR